MASILIVDDEPNIRRMLRGLLEARATPFRRRRTVGPVWSGR
jgi:CheY-like chemotaxis protein